MPVYLQLPDDGDSKYVMVDSAIVRWANGKDAGWSIQKMDTAARARLMRFLEQDTEKLPRRSAAAWT